MSHADTQAKRYVPAIEALKAWVAISLMLLGAAVLPTWIALEIWHLLKSPLPGQ
jgi:hypothetical protein